MTSQIQDQGKALEWRNRQIVAIEEQIEEAFPALLEKLQLEIGERGYWQLATSRHKLGVNIDERVKEWAEEQSRIASERAEKELEVSMDEILAESNDEASFSEWFFDLSSAFGGAGMIAASLAIIPAVVSFSTIPRTVLLVFTATTLSTPLLIAGLATSLAMGAYGLWLLVSARGDLEGRLESRLEPELRKMVFGDPEQPNKPCVISQIQASVISAGRQEILEKMGSRSD